MEFYKTFGFNLFVISYLVLSFITIFAVIRMNKKENVNLWKWLLLSYLFPIVPYFVLRKNRATVK